MQLSLASTRGYAAHLGDLLMLVTFNVMQNENLSGSWWQLVHRPRNVHPVSVTRRDRRFLERRFAVIRFVFHSPLAIPCFILSIGEYDVHRDAMNPRRKLRVTSELREFFPGSHKHILRQLLAPQLAATHPRAQREHPVHMCPVQPLERSPIAGCRKGNISRVVGRLR